MRIVTWNCNGAFRKKFDQIASLDADIYIIQECENPAESNHKNYISWASNHLWVGDSQNKGLGIFVKPSLRLKKLDWSDKFNEHQVKHFLPCVINERINLLGVWTHKNNSPNFGYIGQFWKYLQINKPYMTNTLIAGDFNSNSIWDEWDRWWNHSDVVTTLEEIGLVSYYHCLKNELQGSETTPTLYFRKNYKTTYHIDYFFGPKKLINQVSNFEIGKAEDWIAISDHMPIICDLRSTEIN